MDAANSFDPSIYLFMALDIKKNMFGRLNEFSVSLLTLPPTLLMLLFSCFSARTVVSIVMFSHFKYYCSYFFTLYILVKPTYIYNTAVVHAIHEPTVRQVHWNYMFDVRKS